MTKPPKPPPVKPGHILVTRPGLGGQVSIPAEPKPVIEKRQSRKDKPK